MEVAVELAMAMVELSGFFLGEKTSEKPSVIMGALWFNNNVFDFNGFEFFFFF